MAISSFFRKFEVTDPKTIEKLLHDLENPKKIKLIERDLEQDAKEGLAILKQRITGNRG